MSLAGRGRGPRHPPAKALALRLRLLLVYLRLAGIRRFGGAARTIPPEYCQRPPRPMLMVVLARDHAREGFGHRGMCVGKLWVRYWDQATTVDYLLGHQDVLVEVPWQCVADGDLPDRGCAIEYRSR